MKRSYQWILLSCILIAGFYPAAMAQVQWEGTVNTGLYSSAIGFETQATNKYSFAAGQLSEANGVISIALGYKSTALGHYSVAIGQSAYTASQSYAFGQNAIARGDQSLAIGRFVETGITGMNSIVIGAGSSAVILQNNIPSSLMIGFNSTIPTFFVSSSESYTGIGKVGIGTTAPVARLQIADGDVFIQDIDYGIIMKSPDGNCWRGTLDNTGRLNFYMLPDCENLTTSAESTPETKPLQIFPNPGTDKLFVDNPFSKAALSITDLSGRMIMNKEFGSGEIQIDSQKFPAGTYRQAPI